MKGYLNKLTAAIQYSIQVIWKSIKIAKVLTI